MTLLVYHLIDALVLEENDATLAEALIPGISQRPGVAFHVSPNSGWFHFVDEEQFGTTVPKLHLPANREEALEAAARFFQSANGRIERNQALRAAGFKGLFPKRLQPLVATPVLDFAHNTLDHWLCRYAITLLPSYDEPGAKAVLLWGGGVDVRLGDGGSIIGLSIRWRPPVHRVESEMIPFEIDGESGSSHSHHTSTPTNGTLPAELIYRLEGEHTPQNYCLPYYLVSDGQHMTFAPAAAHSMTVDIVELIRDGGNGKELYALVEGGSGKYQFEWGIWMIDRLKDGFIHAGTGEMISVEPGVYNVALNVTDAETGVIVQTQSTIYAPNKQSPQVS